MDSERVIKGMEHCGIGRSAKQCKGCPYSDEMNCDTVVYADALALLKIRQEMVKDVIELLKEKDEEIDRLKKQLDEAMLWR